MDYKERLNEANETLNGISRRIWEWEAEAIKELKRILTPCGEHGVLIGTEDFDVDIHHLYAEPKPNTFLRVIGLRYLPDNDALEVHLDEVAGDRYMIDSYDTDEDGWIALSRANVPDTRYLLSEVMNNLEYSDGYQPEAEAQEQPNEYEFLIDEDGSPYDPARSLISGGMDIRCDYNEEALFAYKTRKTQTEITAYLTSKGWTLTHDSTYLEFKKGNTSVFFDDYEAEEGGYCCFGTEYEYKTDDGIKALAELKDELCKEDEQPKTKRYAVPFLRTQWADVYVDATSKVEALKKAEAVFNEGHDGWIDWEDVDSPEFDDVRGIEEM